MPLLDRLEAGLREIDARGLRRHRRTIDTPHGAHLRVNAQERVGFAGNDYLGLAAHPQIVAALAEGAQRYGAGSGGSHLLGGHSSAHAQLEDELAAFAGGFVDAPRALYFSTGYMANLAALTALADRNAMVFSDALNHASLIDGMRLARAHVQVYPHADVDTLATMLDDADACLCASSSQATSPSSSPASSLSSSSSSSLSLSLSSSSSSLSPVKLIVTDTVFSMDGDMAPLARLLELAEQHDAWLVVDDAHGFGVLGPQGRGALAQAALRSPRLVLIGTLGKAAGVSGAFVAAHGTVIEWLIQRARPYIFTTASSPAISHAVSASVTLIAGAEGDARRAHLHTLIDHTREILAATRWQPVDSCTAVQPLIIGGNNATLAVADTLERAGLWVPAIRPPTVPAGTSRLRISLSAAHTHDDLDLLHAALQRASRENREMAR